MINKLGVIIFILLCSFTLTKGTCNADEISDDFMSRMSDIQSKIFPMSQDIKLAEIKKRKQDNLEALEISYRGRVPADVKQDSIRAQDALNKAENEFNSIGSEIKSLKSEIVKHYNGKTPKELKNAIDNLQLSYAKQALKNSEEALERSKSGRQ